MPVFLRQFGNAIFFTTLTIYLEELMPFEHFFMGLTMAGLVRNGTVGTMCSGLYSLALRHQIADNMVRGLPYDIPGLMVISIRQALWLYLCGGRGRTHHLPAVGHTACTQYAEEDARLELLGTQGQTLSAQAAGCPHDGDKK